MKRTLLSIAVILALLIPVRAQEKEEKLKELENLEQQTKAVTPPDTLVYEEEEIMPENEMPSEPEIVKENNDETVIRIGSKAVRIINEKDGTEIQVGNREQPHYSKNPRRSFDGHLGGIEIGYNNFSTDRWGRNDIPVEGYFDLNTANSTCFNIIMPPVNLGFSRHFGIVTGLGFNFNNYRFDGNNSVAVDDGGIITPVYPTNGINYEKSKLATVYAILPVMFEVQIPVSHYNTINLGAGVIGAVKLGSHTKVVYFDDGRQKDKNRSDFSLNVLRYGVTARAGYEMVQVYSTFYLSPMFEKGKGPELYPFEVGIALTFND